MRTWRSDSRRRFRSSRAWPSGLGAPSMTFSFSASESPASEGSASVGWLAPASSSSTGGRMPLASAMGSSSSTTTRWCRTERLARSKGRCASMTKHMSSAGAAHSSSIRSRSRAAPQFSSTRERTSASSSSWLKCSMISELAVTGTTVYFTPACCRTVTRILAAQTPSWSAAARMRTVIEEDPCAPCRKASSISSRARPSLARTFRTTIWRDRGPPRL
mmetsp:Transcript_114196/g.333873  ORF Transcript_114196/g.333873 Transcript_114196/m.333873 type:complete len:218 (+) Transcript_114196:1449-2102(+)